MRHAASLFLVFALTAAPAPAGEPARKNLPGADFKPGALKLPLVVTERSGVARKGGALISEAFFGTEKVIGGKGLRGVVKSGDWPERTGPQPADKAEWEAKVKAFQKKQLAFWQAVNLPGAPEPGKAGAEQEMTVSGLAAGKTYFALKSWDAAENMSGLSNVVVVGVK